MKLSVHLVHGGRYVKAGDPLPVDFVLPSHLEAFAVYDDEPPQASQGASRVNSPVVGRQRVFGASGRLAKSAAANYPEGEEEFTPRPKPTRGAKIRRAHQEERKGK